MGTFTSGSKSKRPKRASQPGKQKQSLPPGLGNAIRSFPERLLQVVERGREQAMPDAELGRMLDTPASTIARWWKRRKEGSARPAFRSLYQFHQRLHVNLNWLVTGDEKEPPFIDMALNLENAVAVLRTEIIRIGTAKDFSPDYLDDRIPDGEAFVDAVTAFFLDRR